MRQPSENLSTEIRTCVPISSSTTSILSAMTGGLLPLLRALSSIWIAFAWNWSEKRGHLNVNDIWGVSAGGSEVESPSSGGEEEVGER